MARKKKTSGITSIFDSESDNTLKVITDSRQSGSKQGSESTELIQLNESSWFAYLKNPSHWWAIGLIAFLSLGVMGAGLKYLEDSAKQQRAVSRQSSPVNNKENQSLLSSVNPFVTAPLPSPTPQLSKEYIYAGSRMLAVEDAGASAAPPTDLAVWRPSNGTWYVMAPDGSMRNATQWGQTDDKPAPGDYDGDGKTDFSVFRPSNGTWYIQRSSDSAMLAYAFGISTDKPAQADWDGDGKTDAAVFRGGMWYIQRSSDSTMMSLSFGLSDDTPVPADFDGDGKADIAVWRNSEAKFYIITSSTNYNPANMQVIQFGQTGDLPEVGDFDGDGKADVGIWRGSATPASYQWQILYSSNQTTHAYTIGDPASDKAVQNDYDGDGKVDVAIWRPSNGTWYIVQSHDGSTRTVQWGQAGDIPVPVFYRR